MESKLRGKKGNSLSLVFCPFLFLSHFFIPQVYQFPVFINVLVLKEVELNFMMMEAWKQARAASSAVRLGLSYFFNYFN